MKSWAAILLIGSISWSYLWFTPDQQGQRLLNRGEFRAAADTFRDPVRQGVAWFRAGEFEKAERTFALVATPEAEFNRGNCLVMQGKYEAAIERYDRALELRPDMNDAQVNREIATARAKSVERKGGDMGDQKLGADEITFDKANKAEGQETEITGKQPLSDAQMQAMWLRRVQTKPADFLKSKFAYKFATDSQPASNSE
ncbi:tetratricopeptide repeat protein [Planctomycetaceae bacterium SH139]